LYAATHVPNEQRPKSEIMPDTLEGKPATILVVDDNEVVLTLVVGLLKRANYRVLSAKNGADAIKLANETEGTIDLLLSDVEMPQMSGPDLGESLKQARPDIHVMLMSGGAASGSLLVLNYGWAFIEKPFVPRKLVQMIEEVLHSPDRSQLGGHEFDSRKDLC
jgi:two-component system cell cycle sensor histidine kinase/response regulator CckA